MGRRQITLGVMRAWPWAGLVRGAPHGSLTVVKKYCCPLGALAALFCAALGGAFGRRCGAKNDGGNGWEEMRSEAEGLGPWRPWVGAGFLCRLLGRRD
jgi:hypothetical protein